MNVLLQPSDTRSYPINRLVEISSTRELGHDDAPTARSMPARGNAPGTCPRYLFRPEGAEGFLRPCRAHRWIPKPRALPWATMRRRLQRRNPSCINPNSGVLMIGLLMAFS